MQLSNYLERISQEVELTLHHLLPQISGSGERLREAMRYSVFNGGKRLRPSLFCATLTALGGKYEACLPYAAALEMIHCYSLVHDDLPAMDNDDMRRGKPTCHIVYGEAMAILAGDALLSRASEILTWPLPDISPGQQLAAAGEIMADASWMIKGQALEISSAEMDLELLAEIYEGKTAALFRAAVLGAAALVGADRHQKAALSEYCSALGLAFQIKDDILDIKGETHIIGRDVGSDQKNNKQTYASLLGCEAASAVAEVSAEKAVAALSIFGENAKILRLYPSFFIERKK